MNFITKLPNNCIRIRATLWKITRLHHPDEVHLIVINSLPCLYHFGIELQK